MQAELVLLLGVRFYYQHYFQYTVILQEVALWWTYFRKLKQKLDYTHQQNRVRFESKSARLNKMLQKQTHLFFTEFLCAL